MLTVRQALDAIKDALQPTPGHRQALVLIEGPSIWAYNGQLTASASLREPFPGGPLILPAEALSKAWREGSRATVEDGLLILQHRKTRARIPLLPEHEWDVPGIPLGGEQLTEAQVAAILLASEFASKNAIYPWACGVTLHEGRAIATNNVMVISAECATSQEGTLPFWAISSIRQKAEPPRMLIGDAGVTFGYPDGVLMHSARLAVEMPAKLFELAGALDECDLAFPISEEAFEDAFALGGRHCRMDFETSRLIVTSESGAATETTLDLPEDYRGFPSFQIQEMCARLLIKHASHIGLEQAPGRITFSGREPVAFRGIVAGMV